MKRVEQTADQVATTIEEFLDGTCGPYGWDDFLSITLLDPQLERIRSFCGEVKTLYPPGKQRGYCSTEGFRVLRSLAERLRRGIDLDGRVIEDGESAPESRERRRRGHQRARGTPAAARRSRRRLLIAVVAVAVGISILVAFLGIRTEDEGDDVGDAIATRDAERTTLRVEPLPPRSERETPPSDLPPIPEPTRAPETQRPDGLADAHRALDRLEDLLRSSRSMNEDILAALADVVQLYLQPPPPPGTVTHAPPPDGTATERRFVHEANLRLLAEEEGWSEAYLAKVRTFRRSAERLFLEALRLQKIERRSERNLRDDVNIQAAQILGATGNPQVASKIQNVLETTIFKAQHEVSMQLLVECFAALARIGDEDSLEWMVKEFTHGKRSPRSSVDRLVAAQKAMIVFDRERVPGALRYELVREMIKTYAGVESQASQSSTDVPIQAAKVFWNRIGSDAVKVVQYFSFDPQDEDGEVLATMHEYQEWFRDHKNPRKPPWSND